MQLESVACVSDRYGKDAKSEVTDMGRTVITREHIISELKLPTVRSHHYLYVIMSICMAICVKTEQKQLSCTKKAYILQHGFMDCAAELSLDEWDDALSAENLW